ncbi:MAG: hypothetical protein WCX82_04225, partial [archaeon]
TTDGFSGAEIEAVCREAGLSRIREIVEETEKGKKIESKPVVTKEAFTKAIEKYKVKNENKEEKDYSIR